MAIGYPGSIDTLTNPTSGNNLNSPDHANQHSDENDAIEALEAKVGITGSAVTTSLDYLVANNLGKPMNLTGATAATRYVGGRATSIPTTGTFIAGDFVVLQSGAIGVCTVGGSPGTWVTLSSGSGTFGLGLADYQIYKSGANFIARNTATNIDDFTSTNAASVVQSCHDALGRAGLIELKRGIAYTATSQVTLTTDGVMVRSTPQTGEDQSTSWTVTSSLGNGSSAFQVGSVSAGSGTALGGISIDANGNADYGVDMRAAGGMFFESNVKGGNVANFYLDGPNGAQRCMFWNIRSDNPTNQPLRTVTGIVSQGSGVYRFATSSAHNYLKDQVIALKGFATTGGKFSRPGITLCGTITNISDTTHFDIDLDVAQTFTTSTGTAQRCATNFKFDGPDHVGWGIRSTGAATAGYSFWSDTSRITIASGHITGNNDEAGCVYISGSENRVSDLYLDTGPNGANGNAHMTITGSGNWVSALVQNAATVTALDVTAITQIGGGSSTIWRFTTAAQNFYVGGAVWIAGYASDVTPAPSPTYPSPVAGQSQNCLITAATSTTIDVDLGVTTNPFTAAFVVVKGITKYGVLLQKQKSTSFVQGNELHINFQGKGAKANDGEFYYALGCLDENGNDIANVARFAGNRVYANAAKTTRFSNLEATWGTITNSDKFFADVWSYQQDTTTPTVWRTKAHGETAASSGPTWTINHGLAGLPGSIQIVPTVDPGSGVRYWVSSVTATQIVITASTNITNERWYWTAEL